MNKIVNGLLPILIASLCVECAWPLTAAGQPHDNQPLSVTVTGPEGFAEAYTYDAQADR